MSAGSIFVFERRGTSLGIGNMLKLFESPYDDDRYNYVCGIMIRMVASDSVSNLNVYMNTKCIEKFVLKNIHNLEFHVCFSAIEKVKLVTCLKSQSYGTNL